MVEVKKTFKGVYLTPAQLSKVEKLRREFSKESNTNFSFSSTVVKIIEERK